MHYYKLILRNKEQDGCEVLTISDNVDYFLQDVMGLYVSIRGVKFNIYGKLTDLIETLSIMNKEKVHVPYLLYYDMDQQDFIMTTNY